MAGKARKNPVFANPFFVALLAASTLFVVTTLAYLAAPYATGPRPSGAGAASRALAAWLDRRGPFLLGLEFGVMLTSGVLAMVTEDWFMGRGRGEPPRRD